jgi:hypothetical protein
MIVVKLQYSVKESAMTCNSSFTVPTVRENTQIKKSLITAFVKTS